jgi:hypothetical protein
MRISVRRWPAVITSCLAALGLCACGSAGSGSPAATPPASGAAASTSSAPSATTTASSTAAATSTTSNPTSSAPAHAAAAAGCSSGQIAVSLGRGGAGAGHVGAPLLFRNTGTATCVLTGYPGAALVKPSGGGQVQAIRTPSGYLGGLGSASGAPPIVRLRPGQTVSALLEGSDVAAGGGACPSYSQLLVTPPNQTVTVRLSRTWSSLCRLEVHPVVPGVSGNRR